VHPSFPSEVVELLGRPCCISLRVLQCVAFRDDLYSKAGGYSQTDEVIHQLVSRESAKALRSKELDRT
jgi:hypothetical protein